MIIGLMTAVERQHVYSSYRNLTRVVSFFAYKSVSKIYISTTVFSGFKGKKKPRGKRLTIDAAIFKVDVVIWPQLSLAKTTSSGSLVAAALTIKKKRSLFVSKICIFFVASNY